MEAHKTPEVRRIAKEYMVGKQFKAKFFGSLTITDAKADAAESLKFLRLSSLTSENKQPTVIICLKLKGMSVFGGPSKFAILEAPIERMTYVCHDPEEITTFGIVIRTKDRGLRLHAFQTEQSTAISFVHSSQELFQLAVKIVKAKQKLYEQTQQDNTSEQPPTYASVMLRSHPTAAPVAETNVTSEERAAGVTRRTKTSVQGTSAVPRPCRRSSMYIPDQHKEVPSLSRRASMYSPDQWNEVRKEGTAGLVTSLQDPFYGADMPSHLSSPKSTKSAPGYVGPTPNYALYANMGVGVSSPPSGVPPDWQSSPLTPKTHQFPIGLNQTPLSTGSASSGVSATSLVLPNPLYDSFLTPSPQNAQYMAGSSSAISPLSNQFPTASPNHAGIQTANSQNNVPGAHGSLVSPKLETGAAKVQRRTSRATASRTSSGPVECSPHNSSGKNLPGSTFNDSSQPAPKPSLLYKDASSLPSLKSDHPLSSGPQPLEGGHTSASPFEDNFSPPPQNGSADATRPTDHTFEDSFTSPSNNVLPGDSFQTSLTFEDNFLLSLTFNSFEDNFQLLESPATGQQPAFKDNFNPSFNSTSSNQNAQTVLITKGTTQQPTLGFEDHFVL